MADPYKYTAKPIDGPGNNAVAVTPSDSTDLTTTASFLWVGVAGDVSIECATSGSAIVFKNVQGLLPVRVNRVNSTATTATNIVAVW